MPIEKKRVYEADVSATRVTELSLRTRGKAEQIGPGARSQDGRRTHRGKAFSPDVILRLIDWIKEI